jgi:hypothetical protein
MKSKWIWNDQKLFKIVFKFETPSTNVLKIYSDVPNYVHFFIKLDQLKVTKSNVFSVDLVTFDLLSSLRVNPWTPVQATEEL